MNKKIKNATENEYNGIKFKSKLESNTAKALDNLGIKYEYEQEKFILMPHFKYNGETIRAITYTPDFKVGNVIIECKGFPSDGWKIKRKLFMNLLNNEYPEYSYKEVYSVSELLDFIDMDGRFLTYNILVKTLKGELVEEYDSIKDAIEDLKLNKRSRGNITACLEGKRNKAFNYKWEKVERLFKPIKGEKWRDVVGFESLYSVSSLGRVASKQFHGNINFKILSQTDVDGYKFVKLRDWKNKIESSKAVHRLVAEAFLENNDNKKEVDHIDTNPSNNNLDNLRWTTHLENQRNPITNNRLKESITKLNKLGIGPKASAAKKRKKVIKCENQDTITFSSINEAAKSYNCSPSSILRWCREHKNGWSYGELDTNNQKSNT